jgi:hypothetical protein
VIAELMKGERRSLLLLRLNKQADNTDYHEAELQKL